MPAELWPPCAHGEDIRLVDQATRHIREILHKTVARGLEDVGEYLLETFYDGDVAFYQAVTPNKHASLRSLEARCGTIDLPVSKSFLGNAISMAVLARKIPKSSPFFQLPASHRLELLPMRAPERIERLASKAVESKMSVRKLRDLVRKQRAAFRKEGGPPSRATPRLLGVLMSWERALRDQKSGRLTFRKADVVELTEEQRQQAKQVREVLLRRLDEIDKLLG